MNDYSEMQNELEKALIEIEVTWAAVEAARVTALKAAEAAFDIAKSLRDNWKREDGDTICDFAMRAREIAVQARSRAKLYRETEVCDGFVKRLIKRQAQTLPHSWRGLATHFLPTKFIHWM